MEKIPQESFENDFDFGSNPSGQPQSNNVDFSKLIFVLKKNIYVAIIIIPTIMMVAFLYLRYTKPLYESSSIIQLKINSEAGVLGINSPSLSANSGNISSLSSEIEIIKSKLIFDSVIEKLELEKSYYEYGKILDDEKFQTNTFYIEYTKKNNNLIYDTPFEIIFLNNHSFKLGIAEKDNVKTFQVGNEINLQGFKFKIRRKQSFNKNNVNVPYFFIVNSNRFLNSYLTQNLQVSILNPNASTIKIAFQDHSANKATAIVNMVDSVYLEKTLENKRLEQEQVIHFINEQLDNTAKSLESSEIQLEDFVKKTGTENPSTDFEHIKIKLESLSDEKSILKTDSEMLNHLKNAILSDTGEKFITTFNSNTQTNQLTEEINNLNLAYKSLEKLKATTNPNTLVYQSKIKDVENLENSALEYVFENKKLVTEKMFEVNDKIQKLHDDFLGLPSQNTELTRLKRFYDLWEKFYLKLIEKRVEYGILKAGTVPEFVILSPASAPSNLVYPMSSVIYSTAFFISIFIIVVFIGIRYLLHNKIITPQDLERNLTAPLLGMIPSFKKNKMEFSSLVIDKFPKSAITEALRSIRTNIEFIAPGKSKKTLTVTSTVSGEGKTFVAINLAGVLAVSGQKIIVLDLDMRKPKLHLGFGLTNDFGMSNLLIKQNSLEECIKKSTLENLDFITAGSIPPNPSELIMSKQLDVIIQKLHETYDIIVIDTPPVGLVTDGLLVMQKADIPLYIVRSSYSQRGVENNINSLYKSGRYKNLSVILNAVESSSSYGYGYGYGYGYYEDDINSKN